MKKFHKKNSLVVQKHPGQLLTFSREITNLQVSYYFLIYVHNIFFLSTTLLKLSSFLHFPLVLRVHNFFSFFLNEKYIVFALIVSYHEHFTICTVFLKCIKFQSPNLCFSPTPSLLLHPLSYIFLPTYYFLFGHCIT